jgi:hypothetical protein
MKLAEIKNKKQLNSIHLTGITEEELDKIKDLKELSAYFKKKNKERYNKNHKEYFKSYYEKNKEKIKAGSKLYKHEKRLEKSIVNMALSM